MAAHEEETQPAQEFTGVLLANTGSPSEPTPTAVRSYLKQFLSDPRIVPMPKLLWSVILNLFVLPSRSKRSAQRYEQIWTPEGSPLAIAYESLVPRLHEYYRDKGLNVVVSAGMSYGSPSIADGLRELREQGCTKVVVLPMYPQSAYSTVGAVQDKLDAALLENPFEGELVFVDNYYGNPTYHKAIAASILEAGFDLQSDDTLLFSYHSIPLKDIEHGDTYHTQTESTCLSVAAELGLEASRWRVAYQSRFDKARSWLSPFIREVLDSLAQTAPGRVFVVCPNFSVDCLETLNEIQLEIRSQYLTARAQYHEASDDDFIYVPCLGKSQAHVAVLADVLKPFIESPSDAAGA